MSIIPKVLGNIRPLLHMVYNKGSWVHLILVGVLIIYVTFVSLQEFEKVLKQKQVELELLEAKLAQKSVAVAQERENNMAERQCVSFIITSCVCVHICHVSFL